MIGDGGVHGEQLCITRSEYQSEKTSKIPFTQYRWSLL